MLGGVKIIKKYNFFGIETIVESDDNEFLKLADLNLYFFKKLNKKNKKCCPNSTLNVNFSRAPDKTKFSLDGFSKIATNAYISKNQYVYYEEPLVVKILYSEDTLDITAHYSPSLKHWIKESVFHKNLMNKIDYFPLIRKLIFFPIFWLLEKKRDIFLMHGSAVTYDKTGIIIAGPTNIGKSIGALSLTFDKGARFLTDNFLLFDDTYVYPFPEFIRISKDFRKLINNSTFLENPVLHRFKRDYFQIDDALISGRVSPKVLFIPRIAPEYHLKRLSLEVAIDRILLANDHVKEFQNYHYFGLLDYIFESKYSKYKTRIHNLEKLLSQLEIYELGICKSTKPADLFERALNDVL